MGNERARKRREARQKRKERKRQQACSEGVPSHPLAPSPQLVTFSDPSPLGSDDSTDDEHCPICALLPEGETHTDEYGTQVTTLTGETLDQVMEEFAQQAAMRRSDGRISAEDALEERGTRRCLPERPDVLRRIDRTLFDAEFPSRRYRLEQIYRDCTSRSIFEVLPLPIERNTSPLIAALVDLWNYTPRPPLGEWVPMELVSRYAEAREELIEMREDGRTAMLADAHFVESLHNRAFVDSLDLPDDPVVDKRLLVRAIRAAEHAAEEGCW